MAFVKLDKASPEWVNLDYVVQVEVSGVDVKVLYLKNGTPTSEKVATGADAAEAVTLARRVVQGLSGEIDLT